LVVRVQWIPRAGPYRPFSGFAAVATIGSLYLIESPASHLGTRNALLVTLGIMVAIAAVVSAISRRLRD